MDEPAPGLVEQGYDVVYAAWDDATTLHRVWRKCVTGPDYPDGFEHISFATPAELRQLVDALALREGSDLVDLACGAGGSGLWVARETGARLTGVDFSVAGLAVAARRADALGMADRARFTRGSFAQTGLPDACADGVMTLDAFQYAPDKLDAMQEVARILKPGATFACFAFVLDAAKIASMPGAWDDPVEDYRQPMSEAGLDIVRYESTVDWRDRLSQAYSAVIAEREALTAEIGDRATNALLFEMTLTLERQPYRDRVFAVARKP